MTSRPVLLRHDSPAAPPAEQMALDETLLLAAAPGATWLRFYRWDAPALTFGYAQRWRDVAPLVPNGGPGRAARRLTGGGIVFHGGDLTFSASFPAPAAWNPARIYAALHTRLRHALADSGFAAGIWRQATTSAPHGANGPLRCFASPAPMDLTTPDGGAKILGGALRRMGGRVLYQGSLSLAENLPDTPSLRDALAAAWADFLGCGGVLSEEDPPADSGLLAKYRNPAWTARR